MNKLTISILLVTLIVSYYFSFDQFNPRKSKYGFVKEEEEKSEIFEALNFWTRSRAYPNEDIPSDGYYNAYTYSKSNLFQQDDPVTYNFEQIGPHNIGGRTLDVQFNPQNTNTIFAAAAGGGLWRSFTGGVGVAVWHQVPTAFPVLGVSSIAIVPNDSNTIYIGTGEVYNYQNSIGGLTIRVTRGSYGMGILKTTNYGITWTKCLDWSYNTQRAIQKVRIDPSNYNIIWAATTEGTYKSTDAGQTWNQVHNILMATDVVINPTNGNIVYEACGNLNSTGNGIYRTTNGGTSWTKLTNGLPATYGGKALLEIYQSNPQIIFASIGNGSSSGAGTWLCKSTNGGDNWSIINTTDYSTYQGWYSHWVGVNPTNQNLVLTGGIDVFKSTNGGTTLTQKTYWYNWYFGVTPPGGPEGPPDYVHADQHSITYKPGNPNIIYLGTDGGVFRSTDGGETFAGCNGGFQTTQFYSQFSSSLTSANIGIGGLQDNATAIYLGTDAWKRVIGGDGCATAIHPTNQNIMYGTYQYLALQRTTNFGDSWNGIQPPNSSGTGFYAPFVVCRSNPNIIYAGSNYVHKSTNQGSSWTIMNGGNSLDGNPLLAMTVSNFTTDTIYATTSPINSRGKVFVSFNGGTSWTNITGTLPDRYLTDIAIAPNNASTVYVTLAGFGSSHLFKSTNAGQTWIDIGTTLPDAPGFCVIVDPLNQNNIFFGNDITVYASTDAGNSWFEYSNGLPEAVFVYDMNIINTNHRIRIATHGNGVYEADIDLIQPTTFQLTVNVSNGWNMVSIPGLNSPNQNIDTWWAYRDQSANVFKYFSGYQPITNATAGEGYWMKHSGDRTYNTGDEWPAGGIQIVPHAPLAGVTGWNLIGGYELSVTAANVTTNPPGLQSGPIYKYSGGYQVATTLDPGYGYWIKLTGVGQIIIPETLSKETKSEEYLSENLGKIIFKDASGISYTLYAVNGSTNLSPYELPPTPPAGMFDIRYSSGRIAENINSNAQTILMNGVTYPLTIKAEGIDIRLMDETGKNVNVNLKSGEDVVISDRTINKLMITGELIPAVYALEQNYPNPFNPSTKIRYSLSSKQFVTLKVYDALGAEIATLVNEEKQPGSYEVEFEGVELPSGIYFYNLKAGNFVETKKMILLK